MSSRTLWKIKVDIHQVYNLRLADSSELPDPYIAASLEFPSLADGTYPPRAVQRTPAKSKMSSGNINSVMMFIANVYDLDFPKIRLLVRVHNSKRMAEFLDSDGAVIGAAAFSLTFINGQNNHWLPREWLPITSPDAPGDCRGYIQVSVGVFGPGDEIPIQLSEFQLNSDSSGGQDSISRSILEKIVQTPETNFHSCMLVFSILRAEHLPVLSVGGTDVAPASGYVRISFAGVQMYSRVISSNSNPSWNESVRIPVLCPSWDQHVLVEVFSRAGGRKRGLDTSSAGDLLLCSTAVDFDKLYRTGLPPTWVNMYGFPGVKNASFGAVFGSDYNGRLQITGSVSRSSELHASVVPYDLTAIVEPPTEEIVIYLDIHELAFVDDAISEQSLPEELWIQIQFGPNFFDSNRVSRPSMTCIFDPSIGRISPIRVHIPIDRSMAYDMIFSVFGQYNGVEKVRLCYARLDVDQFMVGILSNGTLPVSDPEWIRLNSVKPGVSDSSSSTFSTGTKVLNTLVEELAERLWNYGTGESVPGLNRQKSTLGDLLTSTNNSEDTLYSVGNILANITAFRTSSSILAGALPVRQERVPYQVRPYELRVSVHQACNLPIAHPVALTSAFVRVTLAGVSARTGIVPVTLYPVWNELVQIEVDLPENPSLRPDVIIEIVDTSFGPMEVLGFSQVKLASLKSTPTWHKLAPPSQSLGVQQDAFVLCSASLLTTTEAAVTPLPSPLPQRSTFTADLLIVGIRLLKNFSIENYNKVEVSWGRQRDNLKKRVVKIQTEKPISGQGGQFNFMQPVQLDLDLAVDANFQEFLEVRLLEQTTTDVDQSAKNESKITGHGYIHLNPHYVWLTDVEQRQYRESFRMKTHEEIRQELEISAVSKKNKKNAGAGAVKRETLRRREYLASQVKSGARDDIELEYIENEIDGMFGIDAKENYISLPMQYFNAVETETLFPARYRTKQDTKKTADKPSFLNDFVWEATVSKEKQEITRPIVESQLEMDLYSLPFVSVPLVVGSINGADSFVVVGYLKVVVNVREKSTNSDELIEIQKTLTRKYEQAERLMCRLYCLRIEGIVPAGADMSVANIIDTTDTSKSYFLWVRNINGDLIAEYPTCSIKDDGSAIETKSNSSSAVNPEFNKCYQLPCSLPENAMLHIELYERVTSGVVGSVTDTFLGSALVDLENRWFSPKYQQLCKHPNEIPIETCTLGDNSGIPKGKVKMWIELMDQVTSMGRPIEALPSPQPETIQVRVALWRTRGVPNLDGEEQTHQGVTMFMHDLDALSSDTHFGSLDGTGTFNWRFVFNPVVPTEDATLRIQVQHRPVVGLSNIPIGEVTLDLSHELAVVRRTRRSIDLPKSWVPISHPAFIGKTRGSVELQIRILTAEEARSFPVGQGRDAPNVDPFLDGDDPHLVQHRSLLANTALGRSLAKFIDAMKSGLRWATILFIIGSIIAGIVGLVVMLMYLGIIKV
jgi:hypothetical protein